MARRTLRLPDALNDEIARIAKDRGFTSTTAFIRAALSDAIARAETETGLAQMERHLLDAMSKHFKRLFAGQQATVAMTDAFARMFIARVPEPHHTDTERNKIQHKQYLQQAGESLRGGLLKALQEIPAEVDQQ